MTMGHVTEVLSIDHLEFDFDGNFMLPMGQGFVSPELVEPREPAPSTEDLIAFRCSSL